MEKNPFSKSWHRVFAVVNGQLTNEPKIESVKSDIECLLLLLANYETNPKSNQ